MPQTTRPNLYPAADHNSQWFADNFGQWSPMALSAPVLVLHTTEGFSWPGYNGNGNIAPTATIWHGHGVRQHFNISQPARALVNLPGGSDTDSQGDIQFELVGTCDPSKKNSGMLYWPEATDEDMTELVDFVVWLHNEWGLKLQSTVTWVAYPGSYGDTMGQRLSTAEWIAYEGILGHEHVPENLHGDPGLFPIQRLFDLCNAKLGKVATVPAQQPQNTNPNVGYDTVLVDDGKGGQIEWSVNSVIKNVRDTHASMEAKLDRIIAKLGA